MNRQKVSRIAWSVVGIFLLFILLGHIPWVTPVDIEMPCAEVTKDGTVVSNGTFTLKGRQLKTLLSKDHLLLLEREYYLDVDSLTLPGVPPMSHDSSDLYLMFSKRITPHAIFGSFWDGSDLRGIYISLEEDWKTCLISLEGGEKYFACSLDGTVPISDILETHQWILD